MAKICVSVENSVIKKYFEDKESVKTPITERLITAGYRQKREGYVDYARQLEIKNPTQWWHLIESWSSRRMPTDKFNRRIKCGELLVYMAEVTKAVDIKRLNKIVDFVIEKYLNERRAGNKYIQDNVYEHIVRKLVDN